MPSRNTQTSKIVIQSDAPNSARITQASKNIIQADAPNSSQLSQISKVIIGTIQLTLNSRMRNGYGQ